MTTTTWRRTLNDLTNWLTTDKIASPKKEDVRLSPVHQHKLNQAIRGATDQKAKVYRVVLTIEEEDIATGATRELTDFSLVISPVLSDRNAATREWADAKSLIERG